MRSRSELAACPYALDNVIEWLGGLIQQLELLEEKNGPLTGFIDSAGRAVLSVGALCDYEAVVAVLVLLMHVLVIALEPSRPEVDTAVIPGPLPAPVAAAVASGVNDGG